MKGKKKLAIAMFFLLGLSTLVFGGFLLYRTAQVDGWNGTSTVMGVVMDSNEAPLEDVTVSWKGIDTLSGPDGLWILENVDEGLITIEFYKEGFVLKTVKWLVYPLYEIGDDMEDSPNNISKSYDIELQREMENADVSGYSEGTLSLVVDGSRQELLGYSKLGAGITGDDLEDHQLNGNSITIELEGDGHFHINLDGGGILLQGFHPVGSTIDITNDLIDALDDEEPSQWVGPTGELLLSFLWEEESPVSYNYIIIERYSNGTVEPRDLETVQDTLRLEIAPGIYRMELTGRDIRDKNIRWLQVDSGGNRTYQIQVEKADVDSEFEDLSVRANYTLSISYMLISFVFFFGGFYIRKEGSWGVLLVLAFIGFLSQGFLTILIFNINHIFALILVIVLISMRGEYNRRRQAMLGRKYAQKT
jgi:hypothetical protein